MRAVDPLKGREMEDSRALCGRRPWPETVLVLQGCVGAWYDLWVGRELNAVMTDSENDDQTNIRPNQYVGGDATGVSGSLDQVALNALPIGTKLREFEVTSLIGVGGFGIVYLAHDHSLGRYVALKEYMPSSLAYRPDGKAVSVRSTRDADTFAAGLRSFINEARLLAQFDHPSLVKVHHFWEESGTAFMVMPFYEGQTLKQALRDMTARFAAIDTADENTPAIDTSRRTTRRMSVVRRGQVGVRQVGVSPIR